MTNIEKQISVLHELQCKAVENGFYGDIELAEKALEYQIPQQAMQFDCVADGLECPNCKSPAKRPKRFCEFCGQALKYG